MDYQLTYNIIRAALDNRQNAYARQTAECWLAEQPGHLTVSVLLAEAVLADGDFRAARHILREVLLADPENVAALQLKMQVHSLEGNAELLWATAAALRQVAPDDPAALAKLAQLARRRPPGSVQTKPSIEMSILALGPALAQMESSWRSGEIELAQQQAEAMLMTYPRLVKAHLILADCYMSQGDEAAGVAHIHQAAGFDPGAEVAQRIWDGEQPYVGAWPVAQVSGMPGPLPHPVASALGMNLLSQPARRTPSNGHGKRAPAVKDAPSVSEEADDPPPLISEIEEALINIQTELNRLDGRTDSGPALADDRGDRVRLQPIYVIITSKARLQAKYGPDGWEQIEGALQALGKAAEARLKIPSGAVYVDDASSLGSFQLDPANPADPAAVKSLIDRLDGQLEEQGKEIGWLLIVGGPDIIAFHRLPNPTDDGDVEILSDNPYGCRDENYFLPQRAVGRMPDSADGDPTVLLRSLSTALAAHHAGRRSQKGWFQQLIATVLWLMRRRRPAGDTSFGYTASVWRKASLTVFSKIGATRNLRVTPPLTAAEFNSLALGPAKYSYFNLHGISDGPAWYGQRDPTFPADYPDFPVALRPQDVGTQGFVPEVVFSEACYGAYVERKTPSSALALKFLSSGAQIFVGSSCIAYGGLNSSLEAADLLAAYFWRELMAGHSGGRALQQAKLAFAKLLDGRQGYLDGEDQKTLISFVYYGDPTLACPPAPRMPITPKKAQKSWKEMTTCPPIVSARGADGQVVDSISPELVKQVRARVAGYLPGMENAKLAVARQQTQRGSGRTKSLEATDKVVFTLHKSAKVAGKTHEQVVKVTVNEAGQMLKLTVSK